MAIEVWIDGLDDEYELILWCTECDQVINAWDNYADITDLQWNADKHLRKSHSKEQHGN